MSHRMHTDSATAAVPLAAQVRAIAVAFAGVYVERLVSGLEPAEAVARAEALVALDEVRNACGLPGLQGDAYPRMTSHALRELMLATAEAPKRRARR